MRAVVLWCIDGISGVRVIRMTFGWGTYTKHYKNHNNVHSPASSSAVNLALATILMA